MPSFLKKHPGFRDTELSALRLENEPFNKSLIAQTWQVIIHCNSTNSRKTRDLIFVNYVSSDLELKAKSAVESNTDLSTFRTAVHHYKFASD